MANYSHYIHDKAADELKARLAAKLGPKADDIWGPHLPQRLRAHTAPRRGQARYPRDFTIYDTSDRNSVMKAILRDMDLDEKIYPPRSILAMIDAAKDQLMSPERYAARQRAEPDPRQRKICEIYTTYASRLLQGRGHGF